MLQLSISPVLCYVTIYHISENPVLMLLLGGSIKTCLGLVKAHVLDLNPYFGCRMHSRATIPGFIKSICLCLH